MSLPDYALITDRLTTPPVISGFPHRVALLPLGTALAGFAQGSVFLIEPDMTSAALNDSALNRHLTDKVPVFFYSRRARDLRPIPWGADAFRARGYSIEVPA